jgi:eukaryotic-like serine/threonine-protein kinase
MTDAMTCPEPDALRGLLHGELPAHEEGRLTGHLDRCDRCQQTLQNLAAGDVTWTAGAVWVPDPPPDAAYHRAVARLKTAPYALAAAPAGPGLGLPPLAPPDGPGQVGRLGPYQVLKVVGSGGMGVVLQAFDPALRRHVAVKLLAPHLATSPDARQRFVREARVAAAVAHDHVVAIHAVEEWQGTPYLVMQYVAGPSLQELLDRAGPLDVREVVRLGAQAAAGLAAAHARGLVHRDVKPANLLLEAETGRLKITDFGLARAVDDATVSHPGAVLGTPDYMAPEQARGEAVDHRADLFSLGSVLYVLGTGRLPFGDGPPLAVLRRVCEEAPPPAHAVHRAVPAWLSAVIARLHAKRPGERFQSAAELGELLTGYLAHLEDPARVPAPPVPGVPASRRSSIRPWARWLNLAAAVLCLLALAGLAGLPRLPWPGARPQGTAGPAPSPLVRLRGPLAGTATPVFAVCFSPAGELLAGACDDGAVRLWDVSTGEPWAVLGGHRCRVWSVAFSPDGKLLASGSGDWFRPAGTGEVKLWDPVTRRELGHFPDRLSQVFSVAFAPDGRTLAFACRDGTAFLWRPFAGGEVAVLRGHTDGVRSVAFSSDGRTLATGSFDGTVRLWDVAGGRPRATLGIRPCKINCVAFSPDGSTLAAAENAPTEGVPPPGSDHAGRVTLWDVATRRPRTTLRGIQGIVLGLAFAPDGKRLAAGGGNWQNFGQVVLWDVPRGKDLCTLLGHRSWVEGVAFSPDGRTLATGGGTSDSPGELKLWNLLAPPD